MKHIRNYLVILWLTIYSTSLLALPVDKTLIPYNSTEGQKILQSSQYKQNFLSLSEYFTTQKTQTYCGLASAEMVLNALPIQRPIDPAYEKYPYFTENNILTPAALKITTPETIKKRGMHISELTSLLNTFPGVKATQYKTKNMPLAEFKKIYKDALRSPNTYIIANIYRPDIHELGGAHFSPIAAYDEKSDRFLLLDVARYKYPAVWVKAENLWQASVSPKGDPEPGFIVVKSTKVFSFT